MSAHCRSVDPAGEELPSRGFFVCIEGPDKCGKTTQAYLLVDALCRLGLRASYTTEPSRGEIGRLIRTHVLRRRKRIPAVMEALLFAVDRFDHSEREVKPMLEKKTVVVSDRYIYSSLAYQGAAGLDLGWIMQINRFSLEPDLAIYIDVPFEILASRMRDNRSVMEDFQTQREVQSVYSKLVRRGMLLGVDGNRPIQEVSKTILDLVLQRLRR